jgi:hypothetical protein
MPELIDLLKSQLRQINQALGQTCVTVTNSLQEARKAGAQAQVTERWRQDFSYETPLEREHLGAERIPINLPKASRLETLADQVVHGRMDMGRIIEGLGCLQDFFELAATLGKAAERHTADK